MGSRSFGYTGAPLTCLWCGQAFRPLIDEISIWEIERGGKQPPVVGERSERHPEHTIAQVTPMVMGERRRRRARPGEKPDVLFVTVEPPLYDAPYYIDSPMFDTIGCAAQFGVRFAELGRRLVSHTQEEE